MLLFPAVNVEDQDDEDQVGRNASGREGRGVGRGEEEGSGDRNPERRVVRQLTLSNPSDGSSRVHSSGFGARILFLHLGFEPPPRENETVCGEFQTVNSPSTNRVWSSEGFSVNPRGCQNCIEG